MKVINFFAGPGAGKSTTAPRLFAELKMKGIKSELIFEFAKQLTWQKRQETLKDQLYVTAKQNHKIEMLKEYNLEYVVTDSPLLQALVYTNESYFLYETYYKMVLQLYDSYDNVNFFLKRTKPYEQYGRSQTEAEARALDVKIYDLLQTHKYKFHVINADENACKNIMNILGL